MPEITFYSNQEKEVCIAVPSGTLLLDAIRKAGLPVDAPCGGHGKCGKCSVTVITGKRTGLHPACQFPVTEDIIVKLKKPSENRILESGSVHIEHRDPVVSSIDAVIPQCQLGEASSDCSRIKHTLGSQVRIPLSVAADLHSRLCDSGYQGNFVLCLDMLTAIRPKSAPCYVLAYDIGTTTIVSYLLDSESGQCLSVSSALNPQTAYGADVISRCEYDVQNKKKELTCLIRSCLDSLAALNAKKAGVSLDDIYFASVVGNTCMQHLYLGVSTQSLLHAPYMATVDELQLLPASYMGLHIHTPAAVCVLPSIAGFVGGDTIGVLLSLPEDTFNELTLILDIGTNGELVLGRGNTRFSCSTAAGPAFEGARISCGMRGAKGAVDHAYLNGNELVLTVIEDTVPAGICGSGLIDIVSCLLELGILSSRGRMEKPEKWKPKVAARYSHRFIKRDGLTVFLLTDDENGIYLTQKDVREVQLAKSAIAAGIEILCKKMKVQTEDIQSVLLAGAFGNYMSARNACRIGLLPAALSGRIRSIGNAAGEGAKLAALDKNALTRSTHLAESTCFVELAASPDFQTAYLEHLNF